MVEGGCGGMTEGRQGTRRGLRFLQTMLVRSASLALVQGRGALSPYPPCPLCRVPGLPAVRHAPAPGRTMGHAAFVPEPGRGGGGRWVVVCSAPGGLYVAEQPLHCLSYLNPVPEVPSDRGWHFFFVPESQGRTSHHQSAFSPGSPRAWDSGRLPSHELSFSFLSSRVSLLSDPCPSRPHCSPRDLY